MLEVEKKFKDAWHKADQAGQVGNRVLAGLRAVQASTVTVEKNEAGSTIITRYDAQGNVAAIETWYEEYHVRAALDRQMARL